LNQARALRFAMVRSMTGFGAGRAADAVRTIVVELRSVNSKSCDVRVRLPRELAALEPRAMAALRTRVSRGRVDLVADLSHSAETGLEPKVNVPLARGYLRAIERLRDELGLTTPIELPMILAGPGVIEGPDSEHDLEEHAKLFDRALDEALAELDRMRAREGDALAVEIARLQREIIEQLTAIKEEVPKSLGQRKARLQARITELLENQELEPLRIAQEIAVMVDRADVTEEIARLESHVAQFSSMLASGETIGRKLDFLLQEMHREANTIGAKSSSARISHLAVDLKSALERLREQIQNVE
jgi:uncharacterized protein (TIGR00255 family)